MKIAFVANTGWNIYNFRKGLVNHFIEKGDEVIFLTPQDEYVLDVKNWGGRWFETPLDATGSNPLKDWSYMRRIRRILLAETPDVVLSYTIKSNIYSCIAAKPLGIPVICNVSGLGTVFLVKGLKGTFAKRLYQYAFRHAAWIYFQNNDDKELFLSKIKLEQSKTDLLPGSGINLREFSERKYRPKRGFKFLMISRLIVEKGVHEFAEVAGKFVGNDDVGFTLVGKFDSSHSRSISKREVDVWVKDNWLTYLPHSNKIKELIEAHDAVILPSYREGTPRTLLEAAAIGRPLMASKVPGCVEVVDDGFNGFLFEVRNSTSLLEKVKLFISLTEEERITMAKNSRELVEAKFDEKLIIDSYEAAIDRMTG